MSRVGKEPLSGDTYLNALSLLERKALDACSNVTIIRTTHPFGDLEDPGPVVGALRRFDRGRAVESVGEAQAQPVYVHDLVDVVEAAIDGRLSAGVVEVGGPSTMTIGGFAALARQTTGERRRRWLRRPSARSLATFLAADSVVSSRLSCRLPVTQHDITEVWTVPT